MTVAELKRVLDQCKPESEVLIRLDDEFFENPAGNVAEILGHEYSYGCTDSLAIMLECGQPEPCRHENAVDGDKVCPDCGGPDGLAKTIFCVTVLGNPSLEQKTHELEAAGWHKKRAGVWQSPSGALFLGPHGAWKAMREQS